MYRIIVLIFSLSLMATNLAAKDFRSAKDQADDVWSEIIDSPYAFLPDFEAAALSENIKILCPHFNNQAFIHKGTTLAKDHPKLLHKLGTSVRVAFRASPQSIFSGLFRSGAEYGILRLSLALPAKNGIIVPGFGLKFFVDDEEPLDILAMPSLKGQSEANLFARPYATMIEPPHWSEVGASIVNFSFSRGLKQAGFINGSTTALSTDHCASIQQDGIKIAQVTAPYKLIFQPTIEAQHLLDGIEQGQNFRELLQDKGSDIVLFKVWGTISPEGQEFFIGDIYTTSTFTSSAFADRELFFKHPKPHTKF